MKKIFVIMLLLIIAPHAYAKPEVFGVERLSRKTNRILMIHRNTTHLLKTRNEQKRCKKR
jgi:hypothetical protein